MVVVCDEPTSITDAYALIKILSRITVCSASRWWPTWSAPCARGRSCSPKLTRVTDRFLDTSLELVACVPYDTNLRAAVPQAETDS